MIVGNDGSVLITNRTPEGGVEQVAADLTLSPGEVGNVRQMLALVDKRLYNDGEMLTFVREYRQVRETYAEQLATVAMQVQNALNAALVIDPALTQEQIRFPQRVQDVSDIGLGDLQLKYNAVREAMEHALNEHKANVKLLESIMQAVEATALSYVLNKRDIQKAQAKAMVPGHPLVVMLRYDLAEVCAVCDAYKARIDQIGRNVQVLSREQSRRQPEFGGR